MVAWEGFVAECGLVTGVSCAAGASPMFTPGLRFMGGMLVVASVVLAMTTAIPTNVTGIPTRPGEPSGAHCGHTDPTRAQGQTPDTSFLGYQFSLPDAITTPCPR